MNVFNLTASLTLDDKNYKTQIEEAKKQTESVATTTEKTSLKTALSWGAIGASVLVVVNTIKDLMYNTTEWAGAIKDLAQVYGMTYEQIQEVNYLAQESGKNAEWAIRKAQSSGQEYWEVLGLTNEEYQEMIANAREMGIILTDDLVDGADRLGDQISQLKYQWEAVLAGLLAGDVNAEENLSKFFDRVMDFAEEFMPVAVQFSIRLFKEIALALIKYAPQLIVQLIEEIINIIYEIDWIELGMNIMKAIIQGVLNILSHTYLGWLKIFGIEPPKVDLGLGSSTSIDTGTSYEITEKVQEELTIRVESSGVTSNDKAVANSLEDLIDEKLGKLLGGM